MKSMFAGEALKGSEEVVPREEQSRQQSIFAIMLGGSGRPVLGRAEPIYVQKPRVCTVQGASEWWW